MALIAQKTVAKIDKPELAFEAESASCSDTATYEASAGGSAAVVWRRSKVNTVPKHGKIVALITQTTLAKIDKPELGIETESVASSSDTATCEAAAGGSAAVV